MDYPEMIRPPGEGFNKALLSTRCMGKEPRWENLYKV